MSLVTAPSRVVSAAMRSAKRQYRLAVELSQNSGEAGRETINLRFVLDLRHSAQIIKRGYPRLDSLFLQTIVNIP